MPNCTQTRTVLVRTRFKNGQPVYTQVVDADEEPRLHSVTLDADIAEEMGNPEIITVTIEPGDKLNP